jgi:hypothetical protein
MLALVLLFLAHAAQPIFGATPGKLPRTVVPIGYSGSASDCNARRFRERCLARAFRIAMTEKLSPAGHISNHG